VHTFSPRFNLEQTKSRLNLSSGFFISIFALMRCPRLLACIDELNAIALILEPAREISSSCPRLSETEFGVMHSAVGKFQHEHPASSTPHPVYPVCIPDIAVLIGGRVAAQTTAVPGLGNGADR
jgi:hypothetical protein